MSTKYGEYAKGLVSEWIAERCDLRDKSARMSVAEVYAAYNKWAVEADRDVLGQNIVSRSCGDVGLQRINWRNTMHVCGIKLKEVSII